MPKSTTATRPLKNFQRFSREALTPFPRSVSDRRVAVGRLAVVVTTLAWLTYSALWVNREFLQHHGVTPFGHVAAEAYLVMVTLLTLASTAYLVSRLGYFYRVRTHRRTPRALLDDFFDRAQPRVTVLVPSYREEERVIRATLLSAALQRVGGLEVVLLIDDPQAPRTEEEARLLDAARRLPAEVGELLAEPARLFGSHYLRFVERDPADEELGLADMTDLADCMQGAATWLRAFADDYPVVDHADRFLCDYVVTSVAAGLLVDATALRTAHENGVVLSAQRMAHFYRRVWATFDVRLTSFERKAYASLSHEPNKASNLNSYISLMGRSFHDVDTEVGRLLLEAPAEESTFTVGEPDYVVTLDADSLLLPEYVERLVYLMEQDHYRDVAVIQTPYSAFPNPGSRLERIAGATTDLQHLVHQGLGHYDAEFWVGANAVIRKRALDDLERVDYLGNFEVRSYISDRTVIEDTESTIDLRIHGWSIENYPERLAYSATPPDFGALSIQRRRWANGGLVILPALRRLVRARRSRGQHTRWGELFLRANYLASIGWTSLSLIAILALPFSSLVLSPVLVVIVAPYFLAMSSDLRYCGYRRRDIVWVYSLNLLLLAVNLTGTAASLIQLLTGGKSTFARTPKVKDRTRTALGFALVPYLLLGLVALTLAVDVRARHWANATFVTVNGLCLLLGVVALMGVWSSLSDIVVQSASLLYRRERAPERPAVTPEHVLANPAVADWEAVLQPALIERRSVSSEAERGRA